MPEISFFKSKRDINLSTSDKKPIAKIADSLYIIKDRGDRARIYYDYDNNTRLEIGSLDNVLYCEIDNKENNNILLVNSSDLYKFTLNGIKTKLTSPYSEIELNKIVTTPNELYIIKQIIPNNDSSILNNELLLIKIYEPKKLQWNEYF